MTGRRASQRRQGLAPIAAIALWAASAVLVAATEVRAQGEFGAGPRFSFIRNDLSTPDTSRTRLSGGMVRLKTSDRTALEIAFDYRAHLNEDLSERVRDLPVQGSLLLYLARASLSPYLLGGVGWYSQKVDQMVNRTVRATTVTREIGYHAGVGADVRVHPRAAIHLDYRYTFIRFGNQSGRAVTQPGAIPIPGLIGLQEKLNLRHEGSMWTTGVTFFF